MSARKILGLAIVLTFILAAGSPAQTARGRWARLGAYLALTETQTGQLQGLVKKHEEAAQPLRLQLREKRQALRAAMDAAEPDATAVGQLAIAQHGLRAQLRDLRKKFRTDFAAILTIEQKAKLEDLKMLRPGGGNRRRLAP